MPQKASRGKKTEAEAVSQRLLAWYDRHRRVLPWRALRGEEPNPYYVWLSEIMLQQTTVKTVGPYFLEFVKRWPSVRHLAKARLDDVLKMWAGLGYYRRARGLHACARKICREYGGVFPSDVDELRKLPGCGPYTAAAIAAIAFDKCANVVDGNVERVVARLFAVKVPLPKAKVKLRSFAETLLPKSRCGDYAQALMDLGATLCSPRSPKCAACPLISFCKAHAAGIAENLPRRERPKEKPVRRGMAFYMESEGKVFLRRRPEKGLLAGMMEIPTTEWLEGPLPTLAEAHKFTPRKGCWTLISGVVKHSFTHFDLELIVARASVTKMWRGKWVPLARLEDEALPSVMLKIVRHARGV